MAEELKSIDVSNHPELLNLAEEVRATREPRLLLRDGEDLALLIPVTNRPRTTAASAGRRSPSPEEVARSRAGIEAAAGSWSGIDAEALKSYIRERRDASSRPPVHL